MEEVHSRVEKGDSATISIAIVPPQELERVWHVAGPMLSASVEMANGQELLSDIRAMLEQQKAFLWILYNNNFEIFGVVVAQITVMPQMLVCNISHLAGSKLDIWLPCLDVIEAWASRHGCRRMICYARPGLKRKLAPRGYVCEHILLEKPLVTTLH